MNETHTIATKETEKMAIKEQLCPSLSPLAIATATAHTMPSFGVELFSQIFISI